mgnify:CR=1 FL=1
MKYTSQDNGGFIGRVADYAATDYHQAPANSLYSFSYDNISYGVATQATRPEGLFFKPDGTLLFVVGADTDKVFSYSLTTAWDLSTASYTGDSLSTSSAGNSPTDIFFKPDGTKLYITGENSNSVGQYSLSTAWDITTASYDSGTGIYSNEDRVVGIAFKPDGTKFYTMGRRNRKFHEYSLSTAWDISTDSYTGNSYAINYEVGLFPTGMTFNSDGTIVYAVGTSYFGSWDLSTAYDVTTATFNSKFSVDADTRGAVFKDDYSKLYTIDFINDVIKQYSANVVLTNKNKKNTGIWSMDADYLNAEAIPDGYRYIKWHITDIGNMAESKTEITELYLKYNGSNISWGSATITNPGGNNPSNEAPPKLIDGDETSKVLDFNVDVDGGSIFIIDAGVGNIFIFDSYYYVTGNGTTNRDPVSWTMEGSNDGTNYTVLHTVTNATITNSRRVDTQTFTL